MSYRTAHLMFVLGIALIVLMFAASNAGAQNLASGDQDGRRVTAEHVDDAGAQRFSVPH